MLINMRNAMMAGGKLSAKSYVQDGLVAMWDGIENAGWGVHDSNATVWKDLVGTYDATRGVSLWGSNCAIMDGSQSGVAKTGSLLGKPSNVTVEVCYVVSIKTPPYCGNGYRNAYVPVGCTSGGGYSIWREENGAGSTEHRRRCVVYWARGYGYPITPIPHVDDEVDVAVTRSLAAGNGAVCYQNAVQVATSSGTALVYNNNCGFNIGGDSDGTRWGVEATMVGRIYTCRVYSRALTSDEIAHNYAVDKARFNLPDAT